MEISDAPVSRLPQNLSLYRQAVTYYISGIFDFFFSGQYHFSFKLSASLYQSLGCL